MSLILTKNNLCELNVFFYKKSFTNIHRPDISYLKIDNHKSADPAFHIGFSENMGYLDSSSVTAGVMVFEVLEGYPLQSLLFFNNDEKFTRNGHFKYRLEDLEPMDFFCIQERGLDPFGDFILRDLKFVSTEMEQGINDAGGRRLVARFVCKEMRPFRIPYFYNNLKSDDYDYHIIRNKKEIEDIKKDILTVKGKWSPERYKSFLNALKTNAADGKKYELEELVSMKYDEFINVYENNPGGKIYTFQPVLQLKDFIKVFYDFKNRIAEKETREDSRLEFLRFVDK